ncbi:MAG: tripartite tricarboxylate transporter TctB family protein [Alcaligenaceae bacterium]|nr:tripartite tricarboxylate transporter TctB family protein [Alcaligenaceae bacterium]
MRLKFNINNREALASGLLILLGLGVMLKGSTYTIGTMARMGPGFFPVMLGVLLMFLGALCLFATGLSTKDEDEEDFSGPSQWRGWIAIVGGVLAFIVLGEYGGLVPATFALVFISALGDRNHSLLSALLLAGFVTVLGVLIFSWGLELQFPMFRWG